MLLTVAVISFTYFIMNRVLENIDVKTFFGVFRVQIVIIQGTRNHTLVGMIEELLKGIIEHIEWNQCARFLIH